MPVPTTLTKEEALRHIADLQRHIDSLPKNNHPAKLEPGMVFQRENRLYILHRPSTTGCDYYLVCLSSDCSGERLSASCIFGAFGPDAYEYLGMSNDVLYARGSNMNFTPNFVKGEVYTTRRGKSITIIEEIRDSKKHSYDCVVGDDGIARYDRPNDVGRGTGQHDPACPDDLIINP